MIVTLLLQYSGSPRIPWLGQEVVYSRCWRTKRQMEQVEVRSSTRVSCWEVGGGMRHHDWTEAYLDITLFNHARGKGVSDTSIFITGMAESGELSKLGWIDSFALWTRTEKPVSVSGTCRRAKPAVGYHT
jgi:hypothetical protein